MSLTAEEARRIAKRDLRCDLEFYIEEIERAVISRAECGAGYLMIFACLSNRPYPNIPLDKWTAIVDHFESQGFVFEDHPDDMRRRETIMRWRDDG